MSISDIEGFQGNSGIARQIGFGGKSVNHGIRLLTRF